ncbi:MFS-type transporter clz9-like protein [Cladobotryum mycophilum]|uniref:MFS-type transporter clz9-like protein n=1 Tax=Cladobotryum mycophilum TaxID=491253 RepID=A0ABR0SJ08_9HYPO
MVYSPKVMKAARAVIQSRDNISRRSRRQGTTTPQVLSVRKSAERYKVSKSQVDRAIKLLTKGEIPAPVGRPLLLNEAEDDALVAYVGWMQQGGFPATKAQVEGAVNALLARRDPGLPPVSRIWYRRWIEAHPHLKITHVKAVEKARYAFENTDIKVIETFFKRLEIIVSKYRIGPSECWNEDECGIRIGSVRERVEVVVIRTTRHQRPKVIDPGSRESCTLIGTVNAVGDAMIPWLIFQVYPTESWAEMEGEDDLRFCRTDTGFSNSEITFEWLHFFNRYSWEKSAKAQKTGKSFIEWFGCDEWKRDPMTREEKEPRSRPRFERIFRLLIIDGFTGHTTLEFIEYCIEFDIVVAVFPSHSTHILQPLDVGVFQPLKNSQQKVIRSMLQSSFFNFSRLDFLTSFKRTYDNGFTKHNIISGFEKSGIYPPTSEPAIRALLKQQRKQRKAINPAYASLLPQEFRFQLAADTIESMTHRYHDILSSPTREGLRIARQVMAEASVMESNLKQFIEDRHDRLERMSSRIKKGRMIKPSGEFFTNSVSLGRIREQAAKSAQLEAEAAHRRHLAAMKKFVMDDLKALKLEYQQNKKQEIDGRIKTLNYQQWLKHTGKYKAYLEIETRNKEFQYLLKQEKYFFDIDRNPHLQEAINEASRAPRPLIAFNFPPSDTSANIITTRENEQEDEPSYGSSNPDIFEEYEDLELQDNTLEETQFDTIFDTVDEQELPPLPQATSPPSSPPVSPPSTPCRIVKSFKMHITESLRTQRSELIYNTHQGVGGRGIAINQAFGVMQLQH